MRNAIINARVGQGVICIDRVEQRRPAGAVLHAGSCSGVPVKKRADVEYRVMLPDGGFLIRKRPGVRGLIRGVKGRREHDAGKQCLQKRQSCQNITLCL